MICCPSAVVIERSNLHVRLAEDHEQVARAGLLEQFVAHRQVGVHARGQDGQLAVALGLFGDVRVEGEAADDEQVEAHALDGFLGGFLDLFRADGAVFRADADAPRALAACRPFSVYSPVAWIHVPA